MSGVKLRSERIDQYDALGERGQPVYMAASQILSTLKRRRGDLAEHFAIPQASADGSLVDWYAPSAGPVVPWTAATEDEKSIASTQLATVRQEVEALRADLTANSESLFGSLLKWVLHHPDPSHVYLVNGKPVITFWGFLNAGADRSVAPLHSLLSPAPYRTALPPAVAAPVAPVSAPPTAAAPWWRSRWWWLLLPLLLAALLLFTLRACAPSVPVLAGLPLIGAARISAPPVDDRSASLVQTPPVDRTRADMPHAESSIAGLAPTAALVGSQTASAGGTNGIQAAAEGTAANDVQALKPDVSHGIGDGGVAAGDARAQTAPPMGDASAPVAGRGPDGNPLVLPPALADGTAAFLNGDWRVRAGIQDRNTGEPLRLQYQFEKGKGHVTLDRRNGSKCQAPVSAVVASGALLISTGAQASCNDGSTYEMPAIRCEPNASHVAACSGNYGSEQFPLTMRQP